MSDLNSLITKDLEHCLISNSTNVCIHHCMEGTSDRRISDKDGLIVPLAPELHTEGRKQKPGERCDVHNCSYMGKLMHIIGQQAWMMNYIIEKYELPFDDIKEEAIDEFRHRYRKSYI